MRPDTYGQLKYKILSGHEVPTCMIEFRRYWNQIIIDRVFTENNRDASGCRSGIVNRLVHCERYRSGHIPFFIPYGGHHVKIPCVRCEILSNMKIF